MENNTTLAAGADIVESVIITQIALLYNSMGKSQRFHSEKNKALL